jgi:preprotein translocase subunit YajC
MEFLPLVALALLFWLFILRPQRRRSQQQAALWSGLEEGTEVVTSGGIYGRITALDDESVQLEVAPGTVLRVDRRAVARVVPPPSTSEESPVT